MSIPRQGRESKGGVQEEGEKQHFSVTLGK
jgi:hypothetical protein